MFITTMIIILSVFALDLTLNILNYKHRLQPIPENVSDVYDQNDYKKWLDYTMEVFKLSIISKVFSTLILLVFLSLNIFPTLAKWSEALHSDLKIQILLFLGLYALISHVLDLGFTLYRTFNIEERYGFNKTTLKTFLLDQIKSLILLIVLGGGLLYTVLTLYLKFGTKSLLISFFILIGVTLLINVLYVKVFIKLFNKLTPLPEGDLYNKCMALAKKSGYEINQISVMDASKRSSRLNAFFSGFGKFKSIVLYDTLIEKCSTDEIISVLAHEIGHSVNKDVLKNLLLGIVEMAFYMFVLSFFLTSSSFSIAFGFDQIHLGFALILFSILLEPIGILSRILTSKISRTAEFKADAYASSMGYKDAMITALKILSRENFSNLTPHPLLVKLTYSHPPTSQRIDALTRK